MIGRDEELQKLLRRWESPPPSAELDRRVWNSFRQSTPRRNPAWIKTWLPLAAGILLVVGIATIWPHRQETPLAARQGVNIATTMDATGFKPLSNGAITVVKAGKKQ